MAGFGVPVIQEIRAETPVAAAEAAGEIGFPVVLKGLGETLTHKTERGAVRLNLTGKETVLAAAADMAAELGDDLTAFLVQPQVAGNREVTAGFFRDPAFGAVVMFGAGGIFAEVTADVVFGVAPLTEPEAAAMPDLIRAGAMLAAFRGEAPADRSAITRTLVALSRIAVEIPEIREIDINPLKIRPDGGVVAVDALVVPGEPPPAKEYPPPVSPKRLGAIFHPRSIAFIGASGRIGKWGHILSTITLAEGYEGDLYFVNPKGKPVMGREVFTAADELPDGVDLAVVTIPAALIPDLMPVFRAKGIRSAVVVASGFAEAGEEGRHLEQALVKSARENDVVFLGPNTMGITNPHIRLYCTGSHVKPGPGDTVVVSQSGNMGTQLLGFAEQQGIGVRGFAGTGNEAMITMEDCLEAFETDDLTRIVMVYLESVKNGPRFIQTARRLSRKKPIVLLKGGRSGAGTRAAAGHTGAMATDNRIFDAVCRQTGIVQVHHPTDLLDLSAGFSALPLPAGGRVAVVTLGGGWGVVAADLLNEYYLTVPDPPPEIIRQIDAFLPPYWSRSNPVDIVGEMDDTVSLKITEILAAWEGCDAVLNLGIMGRVNLLGRYLESIRKADPEYADDFIGAARESFAAFETGYIKHVVHLMETHQKPVIGVSILTTDEDRTLYSVENSRYGGVFYPTPERAVKVLSKMREYREFLNRAR